MGEAAEYGSRAVPGGPRWGIAARLVFAGWIALALGLAWAGQALTTRHLPHRLAGLGVFHRYLPVYSNARELSAALVLLVAGAIVLGAATRRRPDPASAHGAMLALTRPLAGRGRLDAAFLFAVAPALVLWGVFLAWLHQGTYHHWLNLLLLAAVALLALPLIRRDLRGRAPRPRAGAPLALQLALLAGIVGAFVYLNARDLGSWLYSAVGDEYSNFNYARAIARGATFDPWSHRGADRLAAVMGSLGQALFMKLGNEDNYAWKLYTVVVTAAALVPFFFLVRDLFRPRVAVLATIFFASSHYIMGYAHHGLYLDGLLPTTLGLWLLVVGLRRDSSVALFGSGLALALGFYTFESGRAAVVVVCLFMLTFGPRGFRPAVFLPLAGGFILLVLPLFATDGFQQVLHQMFRQSTVEYSAAVTGDRWQRFRENVQYSFVSFNFSAKGRHYVGGSLADPLTAALFVLGLGVAVFRLRRPAYRLLVIWWLVELGFNGFSNPYPLPPISRLHAAVPAVAALAAVAGDAILEPLADQSPWTARISSHRWSLAASGLAVFALGSAALGLNLHRFWYEVPRRFGSTNEATVFRAYQEPQCRNAPVLVVARTDEKMRLFESAFSSYRADPLPTVITYPDAADFITSRSRAELGDPECVIAQYAEQAADHEAAFAAIGSVFPDFVRRTVTDLSGRQQVVLFSRQQSADAP